MISMRRVIITVFSAFIVGLLLTSLVSCTYSVTLAHTEGQATDLIDQNQRADPDVDANLSIPATAL